MDARAQAARRTREAVLDAAVAAFEDRWYDEVTLADVARLAGVSQQTVVNHFGSKENLYLVGVAERFAPQVQQVRAQLRPGDLRSLAETAVADYEQTGTGTLRVLALADRQPALAELVKAGRESHLAWVTGALAPLTADLSEIQREQLNRLAAVAVDVRTWQQLRLAESAAEVIDDMETLLKGVLAFCAPPTGHPA